MPGYTSRGRPSQSVLPRYRQHRPLQQPRSRPVGREVPTAVPSPVGNPATRPEALAVPDSQSAAVATTTREDLERLHPAWVEGLPLRAVLDEAAPEDHELLVDASMLMAFARALISSATLDPRRYRAEARAYRQERVVRATRRVPGAVVDEGASTGRVGEPGWKVLDIPPGQVPGSVLLAPVVRFPRWWVERVDGRVMAVEPPRAFSFREMEMRVAEKPGLFNGVGVRRVWVQIVGL